MTARRCLERDLDEEEGEWGKMREEMFAGKEENGGGGGGGEREGLEGKKGVSSGVEPEKGYLEMGVGGGEREREGG